MRIDILGTREDPRSSSGRSCTSPTMSTSILAVIANLYHAPTTRAKTALTACLRSHPALDHARATAMIHTTLATAHTAPVDRKALVTRPDHTTVLRQKPTPIRRHPQSMSTRCLTPVSTTPIQLVVIAHNDITLRIPACHSIQHFDSVDIAWLQPPLATPAGARIHLPHLDMHIFLEITSRAHDDYDYDYESTSLRPDTGTDAFGYRSGLGLGKASYTMSPLVHMIPGLCKEHLFA